MRAALVAAGRPLARAVRAGRGLPGRGARRQARDKMHSARVAAFASPAAGPVGFVAEDQIELLLGPMADGQVQHRDRL
ncbi:hypothetical protein E1202_08225 [Saccharopolyspora karakumensis]|uniref:Uncharacterized protein n=1 Tax=Saccharopolyspora karakumensis TaxID=2530386 RepID=A0A4R5BU92_9PSEU|nr:hypothetical protein E1202_08225 [Saccharopolyspora karakumensis]